MGTVFAVWPIITLRTRGRVPQGKSYMQTTALVETGIYAIVRHPQGGTAGILFNLALLLIGQHWLLVVLAALGILLIYLDTFNADVACIEKFGKAYVQYMQRVPRVDFSTREGQNRRRLPGGTSIEGRSWRRISCTSSAGS
jgi:protein-S-isoprenylcysteine O-methyltransferase Ste14